VAEWRWELVTDDLLDGLPPAALITVRQVAKELIVRESMIFLDGRELPATERYRRHGLICQCYGKRATWSIWTTRRSSSIV